MPVFVSLNRSRQAMLGCAPRRKSPWGKTMNDRALANHVTPSALFEKAVHASIDAIVFSDMDARITYANPAFARMWGFESANEVIGRPYTVFASAEEAVAIAA